MNRDVGLRPRNAAISAAAWAAVLAWMAVIFYFSSKTGITVWSPLTYVFHFGEYLILGLLLCLALHCSTDMPRAKLLIAALVIASAYGLSDEVHQGFVPTREVSAVDWLIDTGGAMVSLGLWVATLRILAGARVQGDA